MPDFGLLGLPRHTDAGQRFREGFETGTVRNALRAYSQNPGNMNAFAQIAEISPETAWDARAAARDEADYQRDETFRRAAGEYFTGSPGPGVAISTGGSGRSGTDLNQTMARVMGPATPESWGRRRQAMITRGARPEQIPEQMDADWLDNLRRQGEPSIDDAARRERALAMMFRTDPALAIRLRNQEQEAQAEYLELYRDANRWAIAALGGVTDPASWQAAVGEAQRRFAQLGVDITEFVPAEYPGPEGVRQLLLSALDAEEQLAAIDRRDRLEWNIEDDLIDNDRAAMEAESRMEDRAARRSLTEQGQRLRAETTRRGQDIASRDRRRGQNMDSRRPRSRGRRTGRARPNPASNSANPITATGPNGERIRYNRRTGRWEPVGR